MSRATWMVLGALAACRGPAAPVSAGEEPVAVAVQMGALGPGDVFEVRVYGEPDLSGAHRVATDGSVDIPLAGRVAVDGATAAQLSRVLTERLARFVRDPQVSIFVKEFHSQKVFVFGHVQKPGTFPFEQGMSIVQAITLAGGFGQLADERGTFVTRIIEGKEQRIMVSVEAIGEGRQPNFRLEPGDIVYVPESIF